MAALKQSYISWREPVTSTTTTTSTTSSTAFRQQVTQLLQDLVRCEELCKTISRKRRPGRDRASLDQLADGLRASASEIQRQFNLLRRVFSSGMDRGDAAARSALDILLPVARVELQAQLSDVARGRGKGRDDFGTLLRRCLVVEKEAVATFQRLARRLQRRDSESRRDVCAPQTHHPPPPPPQLVRQSGSRGESGQVSLARSDLEALLKHMKHSWVEKAVGGEILYVNKFDAGRTQWERPTGYIKRLR